jgi:N-acyl-D-aspartate/D-glutamate deacylase
MPDYDLVIRDATIVDGTGRPAFPGDLAIRGDRIVAVGAVDGGGAREIDARGLIASPGFVDVHSHADLNVLQYPLLQNYVMQGVTTFVGGNCGLTVAPYRDPADVRPLMRRFSEPVSDIDWRTFGGWLARVERDGIAVNYLPLAGHNTIRTAVMGPEVRRRATETEVAEMREHVEEAMLNGAFGLSTGFDPGAGEYATLEETVELAKVAGRYGGIYTPHTRFHQDSWVDDDPDVHGYGLMHTFKGEIIAGRYHGLLEAVEIARRAGVRLLIAHFTPAYMIPQPQPPLLQRAAAEASLIEIVDKPREQGVDVFFNVIAYTPSIGQPSAISDAFLNPKLALPDWLEGLDKEELSAKLREPAFREQAKAFFYSGRFKIWMIHPVVNPYWMDSFRVLRCKGKQYEGRTIGEIAREKSPSDIVNAVYNASVETVLDLLALDADVTWGFIYDVRENPGALPIFLKHTYGMPCADIYSLPDKANGVELDKAPPIAYGLFPHYIRTFVNELGVLSLEEAVMKATSLPLQQVFGLTDRGVLAEDAFADLVLFDLDRIAMGSDFLDPARPAAGIEQVVVNGRVVYAEMEHTGIRPGRVLRRGKY